MKIYFLSVVFLLSIFSCEKYDAKKELLIQKKVINSYKLTNHGEYPKDISIYFTTDNRDTDPKVISAGISIYSTNKFLIENLKEIVVKSDNDTVSKEASRLLDSVSFAHGYFLAFRNIDYSRFE